MNSKALFTASEKPIEHMPSSGIYVDEEGDWYYQNDRIIREDILELFLSNLSLAANGLFCIEWRGQRSTLEVADTPFVVIRVDRASLAEGQGEGITIRLKHLPEVESLDPSTLRIGKDNIPYCAVRNGQYRARFSRPAYYQLANWIDFDPISEFFFLELNGIRYPVAPLVSS